MDFIIDGQSARLMVGLTDADELLYPLCGVMERLAYDATYDGKGGWQLVQRETGAQLAVINTVGLGRFLPKRRKSRRHPNL